MQTSVRNNSSAFLFIRFEDAVLLCVGKVRLCNIQEVMQFQKTVYAQGGQSLRRVKCEYTSSRVVKGVIKSMELILKQVSVILSE